MDDDQKQLKCPHCDHHFSAEEWYEEDCCPLCKFNEGYDVIPRKVNIDKN